MNVLTIHGFKKSWLEDKKEKSEEIQEQASKRWYSNVPCRIVHTADLGRVVKGRCWFCDLDFEGPEIFFPKVIGTNGTFSAEGQFNSFKCLVSYSRLYYYKQIDASEAYNKCIYLYRLMHPDKKNVTTIPPAPSKYFRTAYGGLYTDEEYIEELNL